MSSVKSFAVAYVFGKKATPMPSAKLRCQLLELKDRPINIGGEFHSISPPLNVPFS